MQNKCDSIHGQQFLNKPLGLNIVVTYTFWTDRNRFLILKRIFSQSINVLNYLNTAVLDRFITEYHWAPFMADKRTM